MFSDYIFIVYCTKILLPLQPISVWVLGHGLMVKMSFLEIKHEHYYSLCLTYIYGIWVVG